MPKDNPEVESCELCGSTENLWVAPQECLLKSYLQPHHLICLDCASKGIDKLVKELHLLKHLSYN